MDSPRDPGEPARPRGGGEERTHLPRLRAFIEPVHLPEGVPANLRRLAAEYNDSARAFLALADAVAASTRAGAGPAPDALAISRSFERVVVNRHLLELELNGIGDAFAGGAHAVPHPRGGS